MNRTIATIIKSTLLLMAPPALGVATGTTIQPFPPNASIQCFERTLSNSPHINGFSLESKNGLIEIYAYKVGKKSLVASGLSCRYSIEGPHFNCIGKHPGSHLQAIYFSQTDSHQHFGGTASYTGLYRELWETDVKKDQTVLIPGYGSAKTNCEFKTTKQKTTTTISEIL